MRIEKGRRQSISPADEEQAHREQHPPAVGQPAVGVGQAARLHPADLRPGADVGHLHPAVVHRDLGDLVPAAAAA